MRVALYLRVSTEEQAKGHSLDSQRHLLREWAEREDWPIAATFEDAGASGTDAAKRPAFQQMVRTAARHEFDAILVKRRDRYARNLADSSLYDALFATHGVRVWSLEEPASNDQTPAGFLMRGMHDLLAAHFSIELAYKTTQGMRTRAEKGLTLSSPPFGYRRPDPRGPLVVDDSAAAQVHHMFERYASGTVSIRDLVTETRINKATIAKMLKNPAYLGHVVYQGEVIRYDQHPAIIEPELFERVRVLRQRRAASPSKLQHKRREYLLSGLAVCNDCGGRMWVNMANSSAYYRCSSANQGRDCAAGTHGVRADEIERQATRWMLAFNFRAKRRQAPAKVDRRGQLEARLRRLTAMVADGLIDYDQGAAEIRDVRAELAAMGDAPTAEQAGAQFTELREEWEQADVARRRAMLLALFSAVRIDIRSAQVVALESRFEWVERL